MEAILSENNSNNSNSDNSNSNNSNNNYDSDNENDYKIKQLNDYFKMIDKSKSFEDQIELLKKRII